MSEFKPVSRYYQAMDMVLCVAEDVSYRSEQISPYVEVLWHPQERYLVGVKVSHAKMVHRSMTADVPAEQPISLLMLIAGALMVGPADIPATLSRAVSDFSKQHGSGLDISPTERARIEFTLAPMS